MKHEVYISCDGAHGLRRSAALIPVEAASEEEAIRLVLAGEGHKAAGFEPEADTSYRLKCGKAFASSFGDEFEDTARGERSMSVKVAETTQAIKSLGVAGGMVQEALSKVIGDLLSTVDPIKALDEFNALPETEKVRVKIDEATSDHDRAADGTLRDLADAHPDGFRDEWRHPDDDDDDDKDPFTPIDPPPITISTNWPASSEKRLGVIGMPYVFESPNYTVEDEHGREWTGVTQAQIDAITTGLHPEQVCGPPTSTQMPKLTAPKGFAKGGPITPLDLSEPYHKSPGDLLLDPRTKHLRDSMTHEMDALSYGEGGIGGPGPKPWSIDLPAGPSVSGTFGLDRGDMPPEVFQIDRDARGNVTLTARDSYGDSHRVDAGSEESAIQIMREQLHQAELDGQPATE